MNTTTGKTPGRQRGLTLIEVAVSIFLFTIIAVPVSFTLVRGMAHRRYTFQQYLAISRLRDLAAEIQETANSPQDLVQQQGIGAVYAKYNNQVFAVPELLNGEITVTCHADEAAVPAVLGGPQDLNFDGDDADDLGNQSNGSDLKLVPTVLTMTYEHENTGHTLSFTMHRLFTNTAE